MVRLATALGVWIAIVPLEDVAAQDALSQLVGDISPPTQIVLVESNLEEVLESLAKLGGFELQLSPGVSESESLTGTFEDDLTNVVRAILAAAEVNYRVVERTLIVGPPRSAFQGVGHARELPACANTFFHLC